jgi:hypothetical protein
MDQKRVQKIIPKKKKKKKKKQRSVSNELIITLTTQYDTIEEVFELNRDSFMEYY